MRAAQIAAFLALAAAARSAAALRGGDVPKGHCHNCEVTCFEDCALKFDREIIQPDLTNTRRLSRRDTKVEAHMKRKLHGIVLAQEAPNATANVTAVVSNYASCLLAEKCPCPVEDGKGKSFLEVAGSKKHCAVGEKACAVGCVGRAVDPAPALLQAKSLVKPGPKDPDDAAIPWSVNVHPVKINTFATGRQNLERCMKSCLAATCGCDDAPGMDAIEDMNNAIKANDAAKDPVEDSPPMWQYRKANIEECGKGMAGKKISSGLYANTGTWTEVCGEKFFAAMGMAADAGMKNCKSSKAPLAGCIWDDQKGKCVYGLKKLIACSVRYKRDTK